MMARLVEGLSRGPLHVAIIGIGLLWMIPTAGAPGQLLPAGSRHRDQRLVDGLPDPRLVHPGELRSASSPAEGMGQSFINSVIITVPAVILTVLVAALAAYAFSWMDFPGRDMLFLLVSVCWWFPSR